MPLLPRALLAASLVWLAGPARPAPPAEPDYTVYAAGDIARCAHPDPAYSGAAATAAIVKAALDADPHAAALPLGDLAYPRGTQAEFANCYGPTWGQFKSRSYPAPGNHEYATPGASAYFAYFGSRAGPGYYSLQLGSWHLISLDSNLGPAAHAAQLAWLAADLARHPALCTLAYWHHPLYSSGGHGSISRMKDAWQLLYQAGAEIVLSGHDHDYERFAPQDADGRADPAGGIRQFVVGTGGAYPTPILWPLNNSEVRDSNRTGVLKLRLLEGRYEWEFVTASYDGLPNGRAPDRGAGQCH